VNQTTSGARRPDGLEGIGCRPPFLICLKGTSSPRFPMHSTDAAIVCHPTFLHVKIPVRFSWSAPENSDKTHACETPIQGLVRDVFGNGQQFRASAPPSFAPAR
jgi:hypothetical protein